VTTSSRVQLVHARGGSELRPEADSLTGLPGYRQRGPSRSWYQGLLLATPAVRDGDGTAVTVHTVTAELDRTSIRRIRTEAAELEAALAEHPNPYLAPLLDHGRTADGRPVLVTAPYGEPAGGAGPLPLEEVHRAATACGSALELLHRAGLLHRGIAPEAVLRYPDGRILLGCPLPAAVAELVAASPGGTGHEPAEVLSGGDWTRSGEVYALASALWTLLAGLPPLAGGREERLVRLLSGAVPVLRRPDIPPHLVTVLRRGLAGEPAGRPGSPAQLAGALMADPAAGAEPAELETAAPSRSPSGGAGGQPIGRRYVKETLLGSGSAGEVWRVQRRSDGARFAAKLLHAQLAGDPDAVHRLLTEQRLLARLSHPNLVRVHDVVADEDVAIVMDLVDGPNLRQLLAGRRLDRTEGLLLLAQVASALAAVHQAGVLHRDLKPANILVTGEPGRRTAKLTDFGIAKVLGEPTRTQTGFVLGTYAYVAPEVITGSEPVQPASDVYSLGVTCYEVLTGARPFSGDVSELLDQHLRRPPARPPDLPEPLWSLLSACLDKRPDRRPSAAQVAAALAGFADPGTPLPAQAAAALAGFTGPSAPVPARAAAPLAGFTGPSASVPAPLSAAPSGAAAWDVSNAPPTQLGRRPLPAAPATPEPPRRRRWPLVAAVLAVVVLGAGLGVWLAWPAPAPRHTPAPTRTSRSAALVDVVPATLTVQRDGTITLRWSGDSSRKPGFGFYLVYRDRELIASGLQRTTYHDTSARPGHCYRYDVQAYGVPPSHRAVPDASSCPTTAAIPDSLTSRRVGTPSPAVVPTSRSAPATTPRTSSAPVTSPEASPSASPHPYPYPRPTPSPSAGPIIPYASPSPSPSA
jgi:serine/threonine protein kinase